MTYPVWSEYKITFDINNKNTLLNYLFSKGIIPAQLKNNHFTYNQFTNYKSADIETSHIGLCTISKDGGNAQITYMPEVDYIKLNNKLIDLEITTDMIDFVMQSQATYTILKRGIIAVKQGLHHPSDKYTTIFDLHIGSFNRPIEHIRFAGLSRETHKLCRLDLIKIFENEKIGWVDPPEDEGIIEKWDLEIERLNTLLKNAINKLKIKDPLITL